MTGIVVGVNGSQSAALALAWAAHQAQLLEHAARNSAAANLGPGVIVPLEG